MTANVEVHSPLDDEPWNHYYRLSADLCLNEKSFQPMENSYFQFVVNDFDVDFQDASPYADVVAKADLNLMEYVAVESKRSMRLGYCLNFGDCPSHVSLLSVAQQLIVAYCGYSIAVAEHGFALGPKPEPCQTNASNYSNVKPCASYSDGKLSHFDVDADL